MLDAFDQWTIYFIHWSPARQGFFTRYRLTSCLVRYWIRSYWIWSYSTRCYSIRSVLVFEGKLLAILFQRKNWMNLQQMMTQVALIPCWDESKQNCLFQEFTLSHQSDDDNNNNSNSNNNNNNKEMKQTANNTRLRPVSWSVKLSARGYFHQI